VGCPSLKRVSVVIDCCISMTMRVCPVFESLVLTVLGKGFNGASTFTQVLYIFRQRYRAMDGWDVVVA